MSKENITIGRRLKELGCPPNLQSEPQLFSLLREYLTNLKPEGSKRNLATLRRGRPEDGDPGVLTTKLETALRSGELGDGLKVVYIAGLIQAGELIAEREINFVKQYYQEHQDFDLGSFTWGR